MLYELMLINMLTNIKKNYLHYPLVLLVQRTIHKNSTAASKLHLKQRFVLQTHGVDP